MKLNNIEWIFFDMGSTLIDETLAMEHRIREVIEGTEVTFEQFAEKKVFYAKQNKPADLETIRFFGLTKTPWHKEDERLFPDTIECLEKFHKHYKIGIIANQSLGSEARLEKFGILKYIDVIVASAEEGVAKPDKRIFEIALEKAQCKPEDAVMVGDRLDNDIVPANEIGMYTIWIKQGNWKDACPRKELEQPDMTVESLGELCEKVLNCLTYQEYEKGNYVTMASDMTVACDNGLINIRVGAIIMKNGQFLMVGNERSDYLYGGRIKFGETAEEAVMREVMEETGVRMEVDRLGFVHENYFYGDAPTNLGKLIYEVSFFFYMKVPQGFEPVSDSFTEDESKEYLRWVSADDSVTIYPEFFRTELKVPEMTVKHFVSDER